MYRVLQVSALTSHKAYYFASRWWLLKDLKTSRVHLWERSGMVPPYERPARVPIPCTQLAAQLQREQQTPCMESECSFSLFHL